MKTEMKGIHSIAKRLGGDGRKGRTVMYHYAWRGGPRILSADPNSAALRAEYEAAVAARRAIEVKVKTFQWVLDEFQKTPEYDKLRPSTKRSNDSYIRKAGREFGSMPVKALSRSTADQIRGRLLAWRSKLAAIAPSTADAAWGQMRRVCKLAKRYNWITYNPFADEAVQEVEKLYYPDRVEIIWIDDDEARFLAEAPHRFRLAFLIALYTGQREGDIVRMEFGKKTTGRATYDGEFFHLKTSKTGAPLKLRAIGPLKVVIDAEMERCGGVGPVLKNALGGPWQGSSFQTMFSRMKNKLGFTRLHFHDLRGSAVTRLRIAGCTIAQICSVTGHSEKEAERILNAHYMGGQQELAEQAMSIYQNDYSTRLRVVSSPIVKEV